MPFDKTQQEAADAIGIGYQYLGKCRKAGKIPGTARKRGGRYFYDLEKLAVAMNKNFDPGQRKKVLKTAEITPEKKQQVVESAGVGGMDFNTARTLSEQFKAALRKQEYEQKSRKLVLTDEVKQAAFDCARIARDAMLNIPDRISDVIAGEDDPMKVRELLTAEIRNAIEGLTGEYK